MTKSKNSTSATSSFMDHADLVRELPQIERMTNQERLKLAHTRRKLQLKNWTQQEKIWAATGMPPPLNPQKGGKGGANASKHPHPMAEQGQGQLEGEGQKKSKRAKNRRIRFRNSIMLLEAAGRNDVEEVRRLLESGVDADVANEDGLTALHQCCIDDNEELLKLLLEFGANVNSEDSEKWTPLHAAATCGHLHLVKHLITQGADLLAVNAEGNMPYDICDEEATLDYIESEMAKRGVTQELIEEIRALPETKMLQDMEHLLVEDGDIHTRDGDGATFLHIAAANGYLRVVEFLLENHLGTEVQDKDCWQPIHAAACWGHIDVLELLVHHGADLNARTKNNETPYAICEDPEIKERIIQLRSEMETKVGGVKRIRRSQSSNSRTQSIRRTSQREKGLSSKRDVADEAQILLTINHIHTKDTSPSPTSDVGSVTPPEQPPPPPPPLPPPHIDLSSGSGSEEDLKSLPPSLVYGRDSITQLQLEREESQSRRRAAGTGAVSPPTAHKTKYVSNYNNNLVQNGGGGGGEEYNNTRIAIPVRNSIRGEAPPSDLPIPDINSSVKGEGLAKTKDTPPSTIDIHVQVTINTNNSPPGTTTSSMASNNNYPLPLTPSTFTPPGTLADLKKQRSLGYATHSRSSSFASTNGTLRDLPPKYEPPSTNAPESLKRFSGHPGDIVGDYSTNGKRCCRIM